MYAKYERKQMVQFIQGIIELFLSPIVPSYNNFDNVDANLVRYFRTEYGRNWKEALSEHLYNINKK